jgi:hypothetical protein
MKVCSKCKEGRPLSEFRKGRASCVTCERAYNREYRSRNKEKVSLKNRKYREDNPNYFKRKREEFKDKNPNYYSNYRYENKERRSLYNKKHREDNKEHYRKYREEYRKKNPHYMRDYSRARRDGDSLYKLKGNLRCLTKSAFREKGYNKDTKTQDILGCDYNELKRRLEDNPYGFTADDPALDIDHIVPLSRAQNKKELLELCCADNLQLLPSRYNQNIKKDNDFNESHFQQWMKENYL